MTPPRDRARHKLALCAFLADQCEESRDMDERANRGLWRRLAEEAMEDARYWAIELYLCGGD